MVTTEVRGGIWLDLPTWSTAVDAEVSIAIGRR